jgi:hypothetical protein
MSDHRQRWMAFWALGLGGWLYGVPAQARDLTIDQRVQAEEAIERAYYAHQLDTTRSFAEAAPRAVLEAKVRRYLKQSLALEQYWSAPITAEALERETERIARETRMPGRLSQIFGALGNDAFLVQECFVRARLADDLARHFHAQDPSLRTKALEEAQTLRAQIQRGMLDPRAEHLHRTVLEWSADLFGEVQDWEGGLSSIEEDAAALTFRVWLGTDTDSIRLAVYSVPKPTWDEWWSEASAMLDETVVRPVASAGARLPAIRGLGGPRAASTDSVAGGACAGLEDVWDNGVFDDMPEARAEATAVWTGNRMIVWGGLDESGFYADGGIYDPATDTWSRLSHIGAPQARHDHRAVWTGQRMIVWGGVVHDTPTSTVLTNSGASYDPATDSWTPLSAAGAPSPRQNYTMVWSGTRVVIWGGEAADGTALNTGARYDPATDTWTPTTLAGVPAERWGHTAIWTGTQMLVWGGRRPNPNAPPYEVIDTGSGYDPVTDSWQPMGETGKPTWRYDHTAVWTGSKMIVWGGRIEGNAWNTGGIYDPVTGTWTATKTPAPVPRIKHAAVWTGTEMIIVGGESLGSGTPVTSGSRYNPSSNTWTSLASGNGGKRQAYVWTGSQLVLWSGEGIGWGRRYSPATDTWTATSKGPGPGRRKKSCVVWTGNQLVVSGGSVEETGANLGKRYDPVTDSWIAMSSAPGSVLYPCKGDWVGSAGRVVMVDETDSDLGVLRYDPIADTWQTGANAAFVDKETVVMAGGDVITWNGSGHDAARYAVSTNQWSLINSDDGPPGATGPTTVWTGQRVIAWGGSYTQEGGIYNVQTDSWNPTALAGAPSVRSYHTAVWSGTRMLIWGGRESPTGPLNTGGRYDPTTNTWGTISTVGAPEARDYHSAAWTGSEMLVWGGQGSVLTNTGGRYAPQTNAWKPMALEGAPDPRLRAQMVWIGERLLVWGTYDNGLIGETHQSFRYGGGQYVICGLAPGTVGNSIRLAKSGNAITLSWDASCSAAAVDYGIYEGTLASLRSGTYDHARVDCTDDAPHLTETISPGAFDSYYLVVPRGSSSEGSYGRDSDGNERPPALLATQRCKELQDLTPCN